MKRQCITLLLLITILLTACQNAGVVTAQRGSGRIVRQNRTVPHFSRIQIYLGADLVLTQEDTEALSIDVDDNLMDDILAEVQNGTLVISTPRDVSLEPSRPVRLNVNFTTLNSIQIFGASTVIGENLNLDTLLIDISGVGSARLTGYVSTQQIVVQGQALISNFNLASSDVSIDIKGAGTVEVSATKTLDVVIEGLGNVRYKGQPQVTQHISGSGNVSQMD